MKILTLLFMTSACMLLTACPSKNNKRANSSVVQKYIVMGDPAETIRGASLDHRGAFEALADRSELNLLTVVIFSEKEEAPDISQTLTQDDLEKKEAPDAEYTGSKAMKALVERVAPNVILVNIPNLEIKFRFIKDSTSSVGFEGLSEDGIEPGQVLHFSESQDGNIFSILVSTQDSTDQAKTLAALYFAKDLNISQPGRTSKPYSYLNGPGIKFGWSQKKTLNIEACGPGAEKIKSQLSQDTTAWNSALAGKLSLNFSVAKTYRPFSDLNQHCIYVVQDLLQEPDPRAGMLGVTVPITDYNTQQLIDADIMIFEKEFKKVYPSLFSAEAKEDLAITTLHEIGHMLGLDHVFGGPMSIMGYDFKIEPKLYPVDIEAIQALYE